MQSRDQLVGTLIAGYNNNNTRTITTSRIAERAEDQLILR